MSPDNVYEEVTPDFHSSREGWEQSDGHNQGQRKEDFNSHRDESREYDVILGGAESIGKSGYM